MSAVLDRTQQRDDARRAIQEAVAELMDGDNFRRWLETRSRFHRYSFGNVLMIAMQCPEAKQVAGYRKWQELGRQVRKGEKAIRILAPIVVKRRDEPGDEPARAVVGFRGASVFDVSQTDGDDLPAAPECVSPDGDELAGMLPALEAHARELGYIVYYYEPEGGALGFCDRDGMRIVVSPSLSPNAQVTTLVHEIAHAHGLTYKDYTRAQCEVIVEATASIVLGSIGFDTSAFTIPYLACWARDEEGLKALETFASTIVATARKIEKALDLA